MNTGTLKLLQGRREARGGRGRGRRHGVAMALVLLVIAITVVLGLCFLSAATSSTPAARLVDDRLQARLVAESGMSVVLAWVRRDGSWRATAAEGVWLQDVALSGGTFTVELFDGEDANGDGVVEGNRNFADDPSAPVTIRVVGSSGDAKHAVKTVYKGSSYGTIAVAERIVMTGQAEIDSYNSQQGPYGNGNKGQSAKASSNLPGGPNLRLSGTSLLDGDVYFPRNADPSRAFAVAPTARMTGVTGTLAQPELTIAPIIPPAYTRSAADSTWASGTTVDLTSDVVCRNFTLAGATKLKVVGNRRIICDGTFTVRDTAEILLDNPKYGYSTPFTSGQNASNNQQIATRFTVPDEVEVRTLAAYIEKSGKDFRLALYANRGNEPGALVVESARHMVRQDSFYWHEVPVTPTRIQPGTYWLALSVITGAPHFSYGPGGRSVHRYHDAVTSNFLADWGTSDESYARSMNLYLTGNAVGKGATLDVYSNRKVYLQGGAVVNQNTQAPSRVRLWHRSGATDSEVLLTGSSQSWATFTVPDAAVRLDQLAKSYGRFKARDYSLNDAAVLHGDVSGGTIDPGIVVGERLDMQLASRLTGITGQAVVASCEGGAPVVRLKMNSALRGDAFAGPGASPADVMVDPAAVLTGDKKVLSSPVGMSVTPPPSGFAGLGNLAVASGTYVLAADHEATSLTVNGTGRLEVRGIVTLVVRGPVSLADRGSITLAPDARLTLHVDGGTVSLAGDALVNDGGAPGNVTIHGSGDDIDLAGKAKVVGAFDAPTALVRMQGQAEVYGNVVARRIAMSERAKIHYDRRPSRLRWSEEW